MKIKERATTYFKSQRINTYTWILFGLYMVLLIWVIIFKTHFSLPLVRPERNINLIPFYFGDGTQNAQIVDIVANFLVFLPFGIYLKMIGLDTKKVILFGFCLSLGFETAQFIFKIGVVDTTDLITNTSGAVCGVLGYLLLCKIFKNKHKLDKVIKILATVATSLSFVIFFILMADEIIWRMSYRK